MSKDITFITGNPNKAKELSKLLGNQITYKSLDLPEIQSLDATEVVVDKAERAYSLLQSTVLVEDTSLTINSLGKLPGPFIKWFYKELGNKQICEITNLYTDKSAIVEIYFALYDGNSVKLFSSKLHGDITSTPRGTNGFGWDAIFQPRNSEQTLAEMNETERQKFNFRKQALLKLSKILGN